MLATGRADRPHSWLGKNAVERPDSNPSAGLPAGGIRDSPSAGLPAGGIVDNCPFCVGHESRTPPETYALRPEGGRPNTDGWLVRTVPNLYPVVAGDGEQAPADPLQSGRGEPDLLVNAPATGSHEVIIHSPQHHTTLADIDPHQFTLAIGGWRERVAAHAESACVHVIVNEGANAGASLEHSHAQSYALDFVPALIARERERFTAHHTRTIGSCLLCDLLQEEVRRAERVIAYDDRAVLIAPYASRAPYEMQLIPRRCAPSIVDAEPASALLLREGLLRLSRVLGGSPPLNLWLRTAPRGAEHYHWRIDVLPRLTQLAGLELGAGVGVNVYEPERAAADLSAAAPEA